MPGKQDDATISQAYREHRAYLVDLAFRMLGDLGAAEDVVQDAFARLLRADAGEIDDERGSPDSRRLEALGATRWDHQAERGFEFWVLRGPWGNEFGVSWPTCPDQSAR
jgi:Sigma-70 region 2